MALFECEELFGGGRVVGGLYGVVGEVCIPTRERGNEWKTLSCRRSRSVHRGNQLKILGF